VSVPGGPDGKYLGKAGPLTAAELREAVAEVLDQVEHEPEVLEQLTAFILAGNLAGVTDILRRASLSARTWASTR
jgi:hypothetical protein